MDGLLNKAEFLIEQSYDTLIRGECDTFLGQPLFRKLAKIYSDEASKAPRLKSISLTHKLLEKLVKKENLNCLIVNLYKGNEGYSLALKVDNVETETVRLPYEEDEFLSYLDAEQLPPMLLDLLDEADLNIFHSGCIVSQVRDFRRSLESLYESKYILLRPTNQSLVADIASLTRDCDWSTDERLQLESEIVQKIAPPLNLSPSPIVALINNKLHHHKYKFSGVQLKRAARRFSQVAQNRQKRFEEALPPPLLKLQGFLSGIKEKRPLAKAVSKPSIPLIKEESKLPWHSLEGKSKQDVEKFYQKVTDEVKRVAQPLERPLDTMDNSLVFVEEYTLETERGQGRIYLTKLTLFQRKTDEAYFGELYVDRDYQEGKQKGSVCRFQLGNLYQVQRYIKQFKEILTEEGRKSVKITHKVAGQTPRVAHTFGSGAREKRDSSGASSAGADHSKQQQQGQIQQQHLKQNVVGSFNIVSQPPSNALPVNIATNNQQSGTAAVIAGGINIAPSQAGPQNVILVSNADGAVKKSVSVIAKQPGTLTSSSASLSSLLAAQTPVQQSTVGQQQLLVGQGVSLASLLTSRQLVANRTVGGATGNTFSVGQNAKVFPQAIAKLSMPTLAAQLSRPAPAYSQTQVTSTKTQVGSSITGIPTELGVQQSAQVVQKERLSVSNASSNPNANLQALLAGSSTENCTLSRNATLLERLSAKSVMLNTSKLPEDDLTGKSTLLNQKVVAQSAPSPVTPSSASAMIRAEAAGVAPPNINLANLTNLPGLNMGLQGLTTANLPGLQNVQVSIPGFALPISLSLNVPGGATGGSSSAIIVTSPSTLNVAAKTTATSAVNTSAATVMIASPSLQQRQLVQLPLSQLTGTQLGAQLTKSVAQAGSGTSTIPVLQVQSVAGSFLTPVRGNPTALAAAPGAVSSPATVLSPQQTVQIGVPTTQALRTTLGEGTLRGTVPTVVSQGGTPIVTLTSKQPLTISKQPSGQLTWQLQQKLMAAKRQQQLQQQVVQTPPK